MPKCLANLNCITEESHGLLTTHCADICVGVRQAHLMCCALRAPAAPTTATGTPDNGAMAQARQLAPMLLPTLPTYYSSSHSLG